MQIILIAQTGTRRLIWDLDTKDALHPPGHQADHMHLQIYEEAQGQK